MCNNHMPRSPKLQDEMAAARPKLSDLDPRDLEHLLTEYGGICATKSDDYHRIDTEEAPPIRQTIGGSP
jgi:hypothetical protein